ncbi:hypothetical protein [Arenimonas oryziterrae]|uniref:Uncharacterized protein n=1 Tax=Arenimonas oryziterrae DSM 21050 = YC6267 TaxID=1121015 RepID=A0A091BEH4_9GAMM|nr:hypothetical protein [Arenimonas oryziterrae]KFN42800.1 hypothetical protein N789_11765 [Arenimonas oryziterrae DSM 21050 = YC6267]
MDGDDRRDRATLVARRDASQSAIQVCFGGKSGAGRCRVIAVQEGLAIDMGLSAMPAGCHSYFEDDKGKSSNGKDLCARTEALAYFKVGSASSFFVYEPQTGKFGRYWDSD